MDITMSPHDLYWNFDPDNETDKGRIKLAQFAVGATPDGIWGKQSNKSYDKWKQNYANKYGGTANPYLDKIMLQEGRYSADRLRQDFADAERLGGWNRPVPASYNFVDPAEAVVGKPSNVGRIEQLRSEIADLEKQIRDYDAEEEMGKYKFLYDADPNTYVNVKQSKRNAEATEAIRKSNEEASKLSMLQNNYRDNAIQMEAAKYDLESKKNAYEAARKSGDTKNLASLNTAYKQALALYNRLERNNTYYMEQLGARLGMPKGSDEEVKGFDVDKDVAGIESLTVLKGTADRLSKDYDDPGYAIKDTERKAKYQDGLDEIRKYEAELEAAKGSIDENARQELITQVDDLKRKVDLWRPGSKSPKKPKRVMEPGDWAKAVDRKNADGSWMTAEQIVKAHDLAFIIKAIEDGAQNPNMARAKALASDKK